MPKVLTVPVLRVLALTLLSRAPIAPLAPLLARAARGCRRGVERFARELLVPVRGEIGEARGDRRVAHHVGRLQALIGIEVRVMRQGLVLDVVLDELESRQADGVERLV